jgi:hypothetical protein
MSRFESVGLGRKRFGEGERERERSRVNQANPQARRERKVAWPLGLRAPRQAEPTVWHRLGLSVYAENECHAVMGVPQRPPPPQGSRRDVNATTHDL